MPTKKWFFWKDFGLKAIHVLMQSTGVSFWCLQVQKYKRESIPGPKVGLLGILGKIYFLVNGVGQSLRFASWYPVVSAPQTHTAMRKPRWWHSTTTHQPLRGILWAPLLQFYFGQRHVQYFVHSWPSIDVGVWGEWNAARLPDCHSRSPDVYISPQTSRIKLCAFNNPVDQIPIARTWVDVCERLYLFAGPGFQPASLSDNHWTC